MNTYLWQVAMSMAVMSAVLLILGKNKRAHVSFNTPRIGGSVRGREGFVLMMCAFMTMALATVIE